MPNLSFASVIQLVSILAPSERFSVAFLSRPMYRRPSASGVGLLFQYVFVPVRFTVASLLIDVEPVRSVAPFCRFSVAVASLPTMS